MLHGRSLDSLGLPQVEGRIDLRGLNAPDPTVSGTSAFADYEIADLSGLTEINGIEWKDLDFTGSRLAELRLMNATIRNCVFDQAYCQGWRAWSTHVQNASFAGADLRGSQMGAPYQGRASRYEKADFTKADLRGASFPSMELEGCLFLQSKFKKLNFNGSSLSNCVFEGTLADVSFYREGMNVDAPPTIAREMANVDFSRAKFRWVEFRGYDLDRVKFPADDGHIVVGDWKHSLGRLIKALKGRSDQGSLGMAAAFEIQLKWAGPNQWRGVISKHDLLEAIGEDHLDEVVNLILSSTPRAT